MAGNANLPIGEGEAATMATLTFDEVLEAAKRLSPEDQLRFIERLKASLRAQQGTSEKRPRWEDLAGTAPYPLCGEDARAWVSRTRAESDEGRRVP